MNNDKLIIGGHEFNSRFILGSGKFSMDMTKSVIENAGVEMATIAVRRADAGSSDSIVDYNIYRFYRLGDTGLAFRYGLACHILRLRSAFFIRKLCYGHSVMRNCYIKHYQL